MTKQDDVPWVFVSHASADLPKVREVRNFMEERGAGPLLFHLRSLTSPEKFWPLIKQEIEARNFFLLCDSEAARASRWVQREREAVAKIGRTRPIRVGRVSLDADEIDFPSIARYLLNLSVYVVHPSSCSFAAIDNVLRKFGYSPLGGIGLSGESIRNLSASTQASEDIFGMMEYGARRGWLLVVMTKEMAEAPYFLELLPLDVAHHRVMFVLTEPYSLPQIDSHRVVDGTNSLQRALVIAAQRMLTAE
jgi:hypothetical protein